MRWVYDDSGIMLKNQYVIQHDYGAIWTNTYWSGVSKVSAHENLYRPIFLSFVSFFHEKPAALGIAMGLASFTVSALLYIHLRKHVTPVIASLVSIFFIVHPANVEVHRQLVGMMDTVPAALGLLALLVLDRAPVAAALLVAIAPGWKETGFIWLAGIALLLACQSIRKRAALLVCCVSASGWLLARHAIYGSFLTSDAPLYSLINPMTAMGFWDRFWTRFALIGHYLRIYFVPIGLSSDYSQGTLPLPGYPIQIWTMLGVAFCCIILQRRRELFTAKSAFLWLPALTMLPILHLTNPGSSIFSERYGYGLFFSLTAGLAPVIGRKFTTLPPLQRRAALSFALGALGLWLTLGIERYQDWDSDLALFSKDSTAYPANAKLHVNYGVALGAQQRWNEARSELEAALSIMPEFPEAHHRLAMVCHETGDIDCERIHATIAASSGY